MTRRTDAANVVISPNHLAPSTPHAFMSDEERAARGRAQIAAGDYIEGDELEAFLDSLTIPTDEA